MSEIMNMDGSGWDESMFDDITGDKPEIIKRVTFLIDRSGSMDGTTIGTINTVMEELLSELDRNDIRIAVAELDEQVEWKTDAPITISQFGAWERTRSGSFSSLGRAFSQLASRLNSAAWQEQGPEGAEGADGSSCIPLRETDRDQFFKSGKSGTAPDFCGK